MEFAHHASRLAVAALLATAAAGCSKASVTRVGEARLVQVDSTVEAGPGPTVEVLPGAAPTIPESGPVRLAIDWEVSYFDIAPTLEALRTAGRPFTVLAVNRQQEIRGFVWEAPPEGESIRYVVTLDGKMCVSLPGEEKAKCIRMASRLIDRAFTRQLIREAHAESGVSAVTIELEPGWDWSNAVRAIDGARTCCTGITMHAGVRRYGGLGYTPE